MPLLLEVGLRAPRHGVEEDRLLDRGHERVADAAQHRVVGPDRELVLPGGLECSRVVQEMALRVLRVEPEAASHDLVDAPAPRLDVVGGDERVRRRMLTVGVHEPDGVEHLHRLVRVQGGDDLRDRVEVAVDELAEAAVVVDGPRPGAAAHEELEGRDAERVLDVDRDEADPKGVLDRRLDLVLLRPCFGIARELLVLHPPDLAHGRRVEMGGHRQHGSNSSAVSTGARRLTRGRKTAITREGIWATCSFSFATGSRPGCRCSSRSCSS